MIRRLYAWRIILIFFGIYFSHCDSNNPVEVIKLVSSSNREFGEIQISNINKITVQNRIGGIILRSTYKPEIVDYFLYKMIKAKTAVKAQERFEEIILDNEFKDDTLVCSIAAPQNTKYYEFYSSLSLDVPYKTSCIVNYPNLGVTASYLDTTLTVLDSEGTIDLIGHNGSCDVKTSVGDINIEMIIPENGFCRGTASIGNIVLQIPKNSSAAIYAKTNKGIISYSNLEISDLVESDGILTGNLGSVAGEIHLETDIGMIEIIGFE